jgi:hypothetical protein
MQKFMRPQQTCFLMALIMQSVTARAGDVSVNVEPHKTVVQLGEPLVVSTTVYNGGRGAVEIFQQNTPTLVYSQPCVVEVRFGADEKQLKRWDDRLRPSRKTEPVVVAPGKSVAVDLVMLFNSRDGFFAKTPGKYWISGRIVTTDRLEVLAPPVEIEVREPAPSDQATWDWLNAHREEYGRLVQVPWEATLSDEFVKECDRLCSTSPSTYVEYLALFLSRSYREGPKKDTAEAARFAEIAKARGSSEKIRTEADKILAAKPAPVSP